MPTLEELLKSNKPGVESVLDEIRKRAKASDINKMLSGSEELTASQIDEINKSADLLSTPDPVPSTQFELKEGSPSTKPLNRTEIQQVKLQNALKNNPASLVGDSYVPKSNFDKLIERLEPSTRMVESTPNISSKLDAIEQAGKSDAAKQALSELDSGLAPKNIPNVIKDSGVLSKLGSVAGKVLPPALLALEAKAGVENLQKGNYMDAAANAAGAGSAGALMAGSKLSGPLAAVSTGYSLGNLTRDAMGMQRGDYDPTPAEGSGGDPLIGKDLKPLGQDAAPVMAEEQEELEKEESNPEVERLKQQLAALLRGNEASAATLGGSPEGFTNASVETLRAAQEKANDTRNASNMMRALNTFNAGVSSLGSGRGPAKANNEYADQMLKQADIPVEQYKQLVEEEIRDPDSAYSQGFKQFARATAKDLGINIPGNMSAEAISKAMPQLTSLYNARENRLARSQDLALRMAEMKSLRVEKQSLKEEKDTESFIERARNQLKPKRDEFSKIARANSIASTMDPKNAVQQVSALYSLISSLDPGSVVREGEINLATSAGGIRGSIENVLSQLVLKPQIIDSKTINDIRKEIGRISRTQEEDYKTIRDSYLKQGKKLGVSEDRFGEIDPYYDQLKNKQNSSGKSVVKKGYNPKTDQTQLIYSDGSKEIVKGKK